MGHSRPMSDGPKHFLRQWFDTEDIFDVSSWYLLEIKQHRNEGETVGVTGVTVDENTFFWTDKRPP